MYKVDGELTRRNRLRTDTNKKFKEIDEILGVVTGKVTEFQKQIDTNIGILKKHYPFKTSSEYS